MVLLSLIVAVASVAEQCVDRLDNGGCAIRAAHANFCAAPWATEHCCATCASPNLENEPAPTSTCTVPKNKCALWSCPDKGSVQAIGASCSVDARRSAMCDRCSVMEADSCTAYQPSVRTCQADGSWVGAEPVCRRFCDAGYTPPLSEIPEKVNVPAESAPQPVAAEAFKVVPLDAPPFGDFLVSKGLDSYMKYRIDVFDQWLVLFTDKCASKYGYNHSIHVANQYAQWLDWEGTGTPNNPEVFAQLQKYNATMVMFDTDGRDLDKFFDGYPYDEILDRHWFHPHDVECDETPYQDRNPDTYDNAYCEVSQQIFNMGYRAVWPSVFGDRKGSDVANAMDKLIGDCGHAYDHTFKYPHCSGKYHYGPLTGSNPQPCERSAATAACLLLIVNCSSDAKAVGSCVGSIPSVQTTAPASMIVWCRSTSGGR